MLSSGRTCSAYDWGRAGKQHDPDPAQEAELVEEFLTAFRAKDLRIEPLTTGGAGVCNIYDPEPRKAVGEAELMLHEETGEGQVPQ